MILNELRIIRWLWRNDRRVLFTDYIRNRVPMV